MFEQPGPDERREFFKEGIQFNNSELQTTPLETEMNVSSHLIEKPVQSNLSMM